tara:strand:- start:27 stop:332 length:306 start_codon:yes stop_codon:yes gene_type:complete
MGKTLDIMAFKMTKPTFGKSPLTQKDPKHKEEGEHKEGDYMMYKSNMYNKDGTLRTNITEEQTSRLKKDKTNRLYATNLDNPSDTIYATPPVVPKKKKKNK